jgi:hypothetical protein
MPDWPFPQDSKEARHRRIIDSYRHGWMKVDPAGCRALDEQMATYGQGWISGGELVGNDELKTARELAALYDLSPRNLYDWARRHPEAITTFRKGGRVLFRVGEVLAYRRSMTCH